MTSIIVPTRHRDALASLTHLTGDEVAELLSALNEPDATAADARELISKASTSTSYDALIALNGTRLSHGYTGEDASRDAIASLGEAAGPTSLATLLEVPLMVRQAKVADLSSATERSLHMARILTDVRPIFDEKAAHDVEAVLVTQTLQMLFFEDGGFTELYVALDREDLDRLRDQVDRAITKAETARRFAEKAGATVFRYEEDRA